MSRVHLELNVARDTKGLYGYISSGNALNVYMGLKEQSTW